MKMKEFLERAISYGIGASIFLWFFILGMMFHQVPEIFDPYRIYIVLLLLPVAGVLSFAKKESLLFLRDFLLLIAAGLSGMYLLLLLFSLILTVKLIVKDQHLR
jgi:hypothetical protein